MPDIELDWIVRELNMKQGLPATRSRGSERLLLSKDRSG